MEMLMMLHAHWLHQLGQINNINTCLDLFTFIWIKSLQSLDAIPNRLSRQSRLHQDNISVAMLYDDDDDTKRTLTLLCQHFPCLQHFCVSQQSRLRKDNTSVAFVLMMMMIPSVHTHYFASLPLVSSIFFLSQILSQPYIQSSRWLSCQPSRKHSPLTQPNHVSLNFWIWHEDYCS